MKLEKLEILVANVVVCLDRIDSLQWVDYGQCISFTCISGFAIEDLERLYKNNEDDNIERNILRRINLCISDLKTMILNMRKEVGMRFITEMNLISTIDKLEALVSAYDN